MRTKFIHIEPWDHRPAANFNISASDGKFEGTGSVAGMARGQKILEGNKEIGNSNFTSTSW